MLKLKINGLFDDEGNNILDTIKPGDVHPCINSGRRKGSTGELKVQCTRRGGGEIALRFYLPEEPVEPVREATEKSIGFIVKKAGGRRVRTPQDKRTVIFAENDK